MNVEKTALLALVIAMVAFATASAVPSLLNIDHVESNSINNAENISTYNLTATQRLITNEMTTIGEQDFTFYGNEYYGIDLYNSSSWDEASIRIYNKDRTQDPHIQFYVYDDDSGDSQTFTIKPREIEFAGWAVFNTLEIQGLIDQTQNNSIHLKRLEGTGSAYVCVDSGGYLYRSTSPCV